MYLNDLHFVLTSNVLDFYYMFNTCKRDIGERRRPGAGLCHPNTTRSSRGVLDLYHGFVYDIRSIN